MKRIVDINKIADNLGPLKLSVLFFACTPFHDCDSVSSFYGKGKVKAWKLMDESNSYDPFISLGKDLEPATELLSKLESFTCALYSHKECSSVNDARFKHFKLQTKALESAMPPNQDSLHKHIHRANYQAAIWRRSSLTGHITMPPPVNHGWKLEEGTLAIDWMDMAPAPKEILELTHCRCRKSKCGNKQCSCIAHSLLCTELCDCMDCSNQPNESDAEDDPSDNESDEEMEELSGYD